MEEIWETIAKERDGNFSDVPLIYVKNFARCIMNFHHQEVVDTSRTGHDVNKSMLGNKDQRSNLTFKPAEIEYISKRYCNLFSNRMNIIMRDRKSLHFVKSV